MLVRTSAPGSFCSGYHFSLANGRTILSMISIINHMRFARKYDLRIPEMNEMVLEFLKTKHLTGKLEHEFESGGSNPTGWVL